MNTETAINHHQNLPGVVESLVKVYQELDSVGLDKQLAQLIVLRASQMNDCAFCVKMHLDEARRDGVTNTRLDRVIVWRHLDDFSESEKSALAWTEALTHLDNRTSYESLRLDLKQHFSDRVISGITFLIGMINMWNRVGVSNHA